MEYGKLVELAKVAFSYETTEEAQVAVGKLLFSGASGELTNRLADLLIEAIKKGN